MWLFAIVTASMPAARSASNAVGFVRKWNCLGCGAPRSVTAVSRFSVVTSAALSSGVIDGPNAVAGSASSFAVRSMKCTSPANSSVMSPAAAGDGVPTPPFAEAVALGTTNFACASVLPVALWQAATNASATDVATNARSRRRRSGGRLRTASL
jgi:hypothetical protein